MFNVRPEIKKPSLISYFIGCEWGVNIVKEYDKQSLYHMLLKCQHYLQLMAKSKVGCANQTTDANFDLDIF